MDCIFCKIINNEVPAKKIFESEDVLVIENIKPEAPFHALAIPKKHFILEETNELSLSDLSQTMYEAIKVADKILPGGYRLISNVGPDSNREIDHAHIHIVGGKNLGGILP